MPISIRDIRNFCDGVILNKDQNGRMRTDDFNIAIQQASDWKLVQTTDNIKEYKPGQPVAPIAWQKSRMISEQLRHLLTMVPMWPDSDGRITLPENLFYTSEIRHPYYVCAGDCKTADDWKKVPRNIPVRIVENDEMGMILNNDLAKPEMSDPAAEFIGGQMQLYPTDIPVVLLYYLRYPTKPIYAVTLTPSGREEFDPVASVDLDWPQSAFNDIAFKCLEFMGVNIRDGEIAQFSDSKERQGT
jgi:hypothetical protein